MAQGAGCPSEGDGRPAFIFACPSLQSPSTAPREMHGLDSRHCGEAAVHDREVVSVFSVLWRANAGASPRPWAAIPLSDAELPAPNWQRQRGLRLALRRWARASMKGLAAARCRILGGTRGCCPANATGKSRQCQAETPPPIRLATVNKGQAASRAIGSHTHERCSSDFAHYL